MLPLKEEISQLLTTLTGLEEAEIKEILEEPPSPEMGDLSFPCFILAKQQRKPPPQISAELAEQLAEKEFTYIEYVKNQGPYLNFYINNFALARELIPQITAGEYIKSWCNVGEGHTVVVDYSAPNIAKPFGIGHLRSTIIGNALYLIYQALGYKCIGVNHLGDWGTQFGKLIAAYRMWGEQEKLEADPVNYAYQIYVKFHEEADKDSVLEDKAREWFCSLENGDEEASRLWKTFCEFSLQEFKRVYKMLGIEFDYYQGESFYNPYLEQTIDLVKDKGLATESEGALIVDLEPYDLPPVVLRKSDGTTLYITRDLSAAIYRYEQFEFSQMLYVVGAEQTLHFQQLFKVLELMGYEWALNCVHVPFGLIRFKEGRMSTREGNIILLKDVIEKAEELAFQIIEEKNPQLENKEEAARAVGLGAIKFGDLCNDRIKDIEFEWDKVLDFTGDTAPYIQYSHARICSILSKSGNEAEIKKLASHDLEDITLAATEEKALLKELSLLPEAVLRSAETNKPSYLARYLVDVAREFNRFYHNCPVLNEEGVKRKSRLLLILATREVLAQGLNLLGIEAPQKM